VSYPTYLLVTLLKVGGTSCSPAPQQRLKINGDGESYSKDPDSPNNFRSCSLVPVKSGGVIVDWELHVKKLTSPCVGDETFRQSSPGSNPPPDASYCDWNGSTTTCGSTEASVVDDD
jgi:hypothetical protein